MISVITATHQRPLEIRRCIGSVDQQTYTDWEHLIVSDGIDPSLYVYNRPPRRQIVELEPMARDWGSSPRNLGLLLAKGEFVAYLDDDNEWDPNHLQSLLGTIGSQDFAFSDVWLVNEQRYIGTGKPEYTHIDTSGLLHRRGLETRWPSGPYENDWRVVEAWLAAGATWACSHRGTVTYHQTHRV